MLDLVAILEAHSKWLRNEPEGVRANLVGANLECANLRSANLECANLVGANLVGANLVGANLRSANLECANLRSANLECANLVGANLVGANLVGANLRGANLVGANLECANLEGANLRSANLEGANLEGANLRGAKGLHFAHCPQEGAFFAYKATANYLLKLQIPADALRTSAIAGRKCRASKAHVIAFFEKDGIPSTATSDVARHTSAFVYNLGQVAVPDSYDADPRLECTSGLHFFMTLEEAQEFANWRTKEFKLPDGCK